ncbi:conserved hypothetical protein [uncultured Desulfobacterium sp.]|uniref:Uncharacterized protein n=1 Tax=uncultured Desulfobacterium sp. TaxID=201089 RepID=A0A445N3Y9_9BACT|nr:conserved hypothetical protein [uncultured Desulfobacterium sp.]
MYIMSWNQKLVVIITDILLILELCISMYLASRTTPELLTPVFMKSFFLMCIPTLVIAWVSVRRLRRQNETI